MPAESHIEYVPEPSAVELRAVIWMAIASLVLLAGSIAGFYSLYRIEVPVKAPPPPRTFAQPRVTTDAADKAELHRLAIEQNERLNTWNWANDGHTLVQIPIDRAMRLLVQKGSDAYEPLLPPQPSLASPAAAAQQAVTPETPNASKTPSPGKTQ